MLEAEHPAVEHEVAARFRPDALPETAHPPRVQVERHRRGQHEGEDETLQSPGATAVRNDPVDGRPRRGQQRRVNQEAHNSYLLGGVRTAMSPSVCCAGTALPGGGNADCGTAGGLARPTGPVRRRAAARGERGLIRFAWRRSSSISSVTLQLRHGGGSAGQSRPSRPSPWQPPGGGSAGLSRTGALRCSGRRPTRHRRAQAPAPRRLPSDRHRGLDGVWVAGASILPTSPEVNPQISIMALAVGVAVAAAR
jgi:hypothetical protein